MSAAMGSGCAMPFTDGVCLVFPSPSSSDELSFGTDISMHAMTTYNESFALCGLTHD